MYVYILSSEIKNWHYVGFTKNVENRIYEHNKGNVTSTKSYKPFKLIFVQVVSDTKIARQLEKFLKIRYNKEVVLELISRGGGMADA